MRTKRFQILFLPIISLGFLLWLWLYIIPIHPNVQASSDATVWPQINLTSYVEGFSKPLYLTHAGDGSRRLFVVEKDGRIRIIADDTRIKQPFLDINERVRSDADDGGGNEEGLLSVAFPPNYAKKGYFYVYYTNLEGNNTVARFHTSPGNPDQADPNSEEHILLFYHPDHRNHNGGQIAFGPDGYLYIGTGDGGGAGDQQGNAQNPDSLLGKLLRIDVEFAFSPPFSHTHELYLPLVRDDSAPLIKTSAYQIPPDNPFVGDSTTLDEIWALGLRNPWRFSFDHLTGDLYLGDVGQSRFEEVNHQPFDSSGGENYGWNIMEGFHCYLKDPCDPSGLILPVAEYSHNLDCSITGGFVYRGEQNRSMQGIYFFGDYCSGKIWGAKMVDGSWMNEMLLDSSLFISSFGVGESGELYVIDIATGTIYKLEENK
jgi:glucose/arabinose dehydrogenase